jgi:hypothetical protein
VLGPWFGLSLMLVYLKPASPGADLSLGISGAGPMVWPLSHASIPEAGLAWSRSVPWDIRCWAMLGLSLILAYLKPASPGADLSLGISGSVPWFSLLSY